MAIPIRFLAFGLAAFVAAACGRDEAHSRLVLAATTSIEDSGLLDVVVAAFAADHPEVELSAVAVGTGQALELARHGDADVVMTHDSAAEVALVESGLALERRSVMHNYFLIAGPQSDPARVRGEAAAAGLAAIARRRALFVSRGDDSGTHRRERQLWQQAAIDPDTAAEAWYIEAGVGMGDALLIAGQKRAYILTDRATFLKFAARSNLEALCEGDADLLNSYGVTIMKGPRVAAARKFAEWIVGTNAQKIIGDYGRAEFGEALFTSSVHGAAIHDTIPTGERSMR